MDQAYEESKIGMSFRYNPFEDSPLKAKARGLSTNGFRANPKFLSQASDKREVQREIDTLDKLLG
jgi:hypothetical protein